MAENIKTLNLDQKLLELRRYVDVVRKSKRGYGYTYPSIVEMRAKLKAGMDKLQILLEPHYVLGSQRITPDHYQKPKVLKDGTVIDETIHEFVVSQDIIWKWIDVASGQTKEIPWPSCGEQSDPSQAQGGAFTYAQRQFLTQYFQIATPDDDPDQYRSQKEQAEQEAMLAVARQIVTKINAHVHGYLAIHQNSDDARKTVTTLIKQYVRNGSKPSVDYNTYLTDPATAGKLLEALQKQLPLTGADDEHIKNGGKQ